MPPALNGIVVVDKPKGISSAGVVARVKGIFGVNKVGHTGTLDPFATGVLICCINQATRLSQFFLKGDKVYDTNTLLLLLFSIILFQLFFLSVGMVLSLLMKRVRSVTSASMALAFGMYVLSAFGGMLGADTFDLITPFKHFDPNSIITNGAYDMPLVTISVVAIVISFVGSYVLYSKRNIQTAI